MNETPPLPQSLGNDPENALTSQQFDEFKEALEVLYIIANISGRIQFAKAWPAAADHIMGEELLKLDHDGAEDKERRAELEQEAEDRRLQLLEFIDNVESKSMDSGALNLEYVRQNVERLGRDLSLCIYGTRIVDRFIAPPPPLPEDQDGGGDEQLDVGAQADVPDALKQQDTLESDLSNSDFSNELDKGIEQRKHVQSAAQHDIEQKEEADKNEDAGQAPSPEASPQDVPPPPQDDVDPLDSIKPIDVSAEPQSPPMPEAPQAPTQPQAPEPFEEDEKPLFVAGQPPEPPPQSAPQEPTAAPQEQQQSQGIQNPATPPQSEAPPAPPAPNTPPAQSPVSPVVNPVSPVTPVQQNAGEQKETPMKFMSSKDTDKGDGGENP